MPNDNESPDHAGLRRSTTEIASDVLDHISRMPNRDAEVDAVRTFGKACYREGVASQSAELATLRADRSRLNDEVNMLASRLAALEGD